jgi:hypothetical protein
VFVLAGAVTCCGMLPAAKWLKLSRRTMSMTLLPPLLKRFRHGRPDRGRSLSK